MASTSLYFKNRTRMQSSGPAALPESDLNVANQRLAVAESNLSLLQSGGAATLKQKMLIKKAEEHVAEMRKAQEVLSLCHVHAQHGCSPAVSCVTSRLTDCCLRAAPRTAPHPAFAICQYPAFAIYQYAAFAIPIGAVIHSSQINIRVSILIQARDLGAAEAFDRTRAGQSARHRYEDARLLLS